MANRDYGKKSGSVVKMAGGGEVEPGMDRAAPSSGPAFGGFFDRMFARKDGGAPVEDRTPTPVNPEPKAPERSDEDGDGVVVKADKSDIERDTRSQPAETPTKASGASPMPARRKSKGFAAGLANGLASGTKDGRGSSEAGAMEASYKPRSSGADSTGSVIPMKSTADALGDVDPNTLLPKKRMANGGAVGGGHYGKCK